MKAILYALAIFLAAGASVVWAGPAPTATAAPAASGTTATTSTAPADAALQKDLEGVLADYRAACKAGDVAKFRECVSSHLYSTLANNLASAAREPDAEVLAQMLRAESMMAEFKLASVLHEGATAGLLYAHPSPAHGIQEAKIEVLLRRFVKENDAWKIDANALTGVPATKADGSPSTATDATWVAEQAVNGKVLPAEPLLPKADVAGIVNVMVHGYIVTVTINGLSQVTDYEDGYISKLVRGGLKKGANTIKVTVRPSAKPAIVKSLEIEVKSQLPGQTDKTLVYSLKPADEPQAAYEATFSVEVSAPTAKDK